MVIFFKYGFIMCFRTVFALIDSTTGYAGEVLVHGLYNWELL